MGISGLLPTLKPITRLVKVSSYASKRLAVDVYGWLHRGAFACALELVQGAETDVYVKYCMKRVEMLRHHGVIPVMVFDGSHLPAKRGTEMDRAEKRELARAKGTELLRNGLRTEAINVFQRSCDVTPFMAHSLIQALRDHKVEYVVAPYEADAQMAYLYKEGLVDAIITEDSDLTVFGCRRLLVKMDEFGNAEEVNFDLANDPEVLAQQFEMGSWPLEKFRRMCILSGCDYLDSLPGIGLKTAFKLLKTNGTVERALAEIAKKGTVVPPEYYINFVKADETFLYQRVFDPRSQKMVCLNTPPIGFDLTQPHIGPIMDEATVIELAHGRLNPLTFEAMPFNDNAAKASSSTTFTFSKSRSSGTAIPEHMINQPSIAAYFGTAKPKPIVASSTLNTQFSIKRKSSAIELTDSPVEEPPLLNKTVIPSFRAPRASSMTEERVVVSKFFKNTAVFDRAKSDSVLPSSSLEDSQDLSAASLNISIGQTTTITTSVSIAETTVASVDEEVAMEDLEERVMQKFEHEESPPNASALSSREKISALSVAYAFAKTGGDCTRVTKARIGLAKPKGKVFPTAPAQSLLKVDIEQFKRTGVTKNV